MKDIKEPTEWRKVLSRPKDHLGRGPGTFLAVKTIALDVQWTAGKETGEKEGAF